MPLSRAARSWLAALPPFAERPFPPAPDDFEGWRNWQARAQRQGRERSTTALAAYSSVNVRALSADGTVIRLATRAAESSPLRIIFLHGGGYTAFSAASTLFASAPLASSLDIEVIAIDYPKAPFATCLDIVATTVSRLLPYLTPRTFLLGDSAGGGLALSVVHVLRRRGHITLPAGVILWSPWVDLKADDPSIDDPILRYRQDLEICATCYAGNLPLDDPRASPINGDYGPWHPPTLIQAGGREIFLRSLRSLRHKMIASGADCQLSVWDELFHSFPSILPQLSESREARSGIATFIDSVLAGRDIALPP